MPRPPSAAASGRQPLYNSISLPFLLLCCVLCLSLSATFSNAFLLPPPPRASLTLTRPFTTSTTTSSSSRNPRASLLSASRASSTFPLSSTVTSSLEGGLNLPPQKKGTWQDKLDTLYRFTRPHTIRGTILASFMGVLRCLIETPKAFTFTPTLVSRALLGLLALLCGNVFIVGINQIYDVDIDRVNKPFLPLAASRMSGSTAWAVVVAACVGGLAITKHFFSSLIFNMYAAGLLVGGLYSIPPFYFKQYPLVAAATIAFVRGFSLNFGVYYAVREALGIPFAWNPIVNFITRFMTVFAAVIAVSKDLPDTEGDRKYNVQTFATKVGVKNMARGATAVLFLNYVVAVVEGVVNKGGAFRPVTMVGGHALLAILLLTRFRKLNPESLTDIKAFYKSIWDLFYLEYCLYPFL